ncbi:MAG: DUF2807 domain-containing protein [Bacteroidia bacterium]|nr:DUF2807 domain-containing protein [Bacteroidia bacterium]
MKITIISMAVSALLFTSCRFDTRWITGNGDVITESRQVQGFSGIALNLNADVYFVQDSVYRIEISAQKNVLDAIETSTNGNTLKIAYTPFTIVRRHKQITVRIHAPHVNEFNVNGSGNIYTDKINESDKMQFVVNGSGSIEVQNVTAPEMQATISGSGNCTVKGGTVETAGLRISGSGDLHCADLMCKYGNIDISGSGNADIYATETLEVNISGSGDVRYKGKPRMTQRISGSGSVRSW